jgi:hypothetical protein
MARWVIYSTCSIFALCSMGAVAASPGSADLTVPAPSARAEDAARSPTAGESTDGAGAAATDPTRA